jgi:hypothetical protein
MELALRVAATSSPQRDERMPDASQDDQALRFGYEFGYQSIFAIDIYI